MGNCTLKGIIIIADPMSGLILCLERAHERTSDEIARTIDKLKAARPMIEGSIKLCLTDMYKAYAGTVKKLLPLAKHQYCWFHINCFHIGATVKKAERTYKRAVKQLEEFDKKAKKQILTAEQKQERVALEEVCIQAKKEWLGSQRFQRMLMKTLKARSWQDAQKALDRLIASGNRISNPYVKQMASFLENHYEQLLSYYICIESNKHVIKRLSSSKQKLRFASPWGMGKCKQALGSTDYDKRGRTCFSTVASLYEEHGAVWN